MNEKQPSQGRQEPLAAAGAQPAPRPPEPNRRLQAYTGGILAGIAIGVGLAVVMHAIEQRTPGSGHGITGNVVLVVFIGLVIGLGLGMGFDAAVPETTGDSAALRHATPADQPPAPAA
jgi:hypothetical protein